MNHQVGGPGGPQPQTINVDLRQAEDVVCAKCGCPYFQECLRMKKLSVLLSPTGKEEHVPLQTLLCLGCGHEFGQPVPSMEPEEK